MASEDEERLTDRLLKYLFLERSSSRYWRNTISRFLNPSLTISGLVVAFGLGYFASHGLNQEKESEKDISNISRYTMRVVELSPEIGGEAGGVVAKLGFSGKISGGLAFILDNETGSLYAAVAYSTPLLKKLLGAKKFNYLGMTYIDQLDNVRKRDEKKGQRTKTIENYFASRALTS